jgi:ubiquitin-protein ligase E3 C
MAQLSPRLGVLNNIPFAIPFDVRVAIFKSVISTDRWRLQAEQHLDSFGSQGATVIRRNHIAQDGFDKLQDVDLKRTVRIIFIDQFGNPE